MRNVFHEFQRLAGFHNPAFPLLEDARSLLPNEFTDPAVENFVFLVSNQVAERLVDESNAQIGIFHQNRIGEVVDNVLGEPFSNLGRFQLPVAAQLVRDVGDMGDEQPTGQTALAEPYPATVRQLLHVIVALAPMDGDTFGNPVIARDASAFLLGSTEASAAIIDGSEEVAQSGADDQAFVGNVEEAAEVFR